MRKGTFILASVFALLLALPTPVFALQVGADCGYGSLGLFHSRGNSSNYQHHTHDGVKVSWYFMGTETHTKNWGGHTGYQYATLTGTYITGYAFCPS